jgi:hypothetical protein
MVLSAGKDVTGAQIGNWFQNRSWGRKGTMGRLSAVCGLLEAAATATACASAARFAAASATAWATSACEIASTNAARAAMTSIASLDCPRLCQWRVPSSRICPPVPCPPPRVVNGVPAVSAFLITQHLSPHKDLQFKPPRTIHQVLDWVPAAPFTFLFSHHLMQTRNYTRPRRDIWCDMEPRNNSD